MEPVFLGIVGWQELLIVALILLIFFGGRKIPELMRSLGKGIREFKEGMNEVTNIDETSTSNTQQQAKREETVENTK